MRTWSYAPVAVTLKVSLAAVVVKIGHSMFDCPEQRYTSPKPTSASVAGALVAFEQPAHAAAKA
jgi:hypothetical protein